MTNQSQPTQNATTEEKCASVSENKPVPTQGLAPEVKCAPATLALEPYLAKDSLYWRMEANVPPSIFHDSKPGHGILAHADQDSVVVYQAFHAAIATYAARHQTFIGAPGYKETRMTWIKPNFLWMNYRSGWGHKDKNQTHTLAIRLTRTFFDALCNDAMSTKIKTTGECPVRVQWDPDYTANLEPERILSVHRRAIQLGLRGVASHRLARADKADVLSIEDITDYVKEMHQRLTLAKSAEGDARYQTLLVPVERPYSCDPEATLKI
ncbi:hypothetical protein DM01DRAFT_1386353 [Hesseltinella vesiculosa]|uniref:Uncharacterized protein n=1 Tax=Hesseltinella vesiculosa TaxID=101127 RepID=A0A1X2G7C3_9FUNG|nr:hypothetical protein DM01DRAFT_1386353 [Hesseltinella vesiculosa]